MKIQEATVWAGLKPEHGDKITEKDFRFGLSIAERSLSQIIKEDLTFTIARCFGFFGLHAIEWHLCQLTLRWDGTDKGSIDLTNDWVKTNRPKLWEREVDLWRDDDAEAV